MLLDKNKFPEAGFLGDDLFQNTQQELENRCRIVVSAIERKIFTVDEALKAYQVTENDLLNYHVAHLIKALDIVDAQSSKAKAIHTISLVERLMKLIFKESSEIGILIIYDHLHHLTEDIEKDRVKVDA